MLKQYMFSIVLCVATLGAVTPSHCMETTNKVTQTLNGKKVTYDQKKLRYWQICTLDQETNTYHSVKHWGEDTVTEKKNQRGAFEKLKAAYMLQQSNTAQDDVSREN